MEIKISDEARAAAVGTIRDEHGIFETASVLPDLSLGNAPLAASATESFRGEWDATVTLYHELLDAISVSLGAVADSLIQIDRQMSEAPPTGGGPR